MYIWWVYKTPRNGCINPMQNPSHPVDPNPASSPAASVTVRGLGTSGSGPDSDSGFDSGSGCLLQLLDVRRLAHS